MIDILKIEEADSTNSWVAAHDSELDWPLLVWCHTQTSGRGQRGNSWESEPGKNITASFLLRPENFPACEQFMISEAVALAVVDFLRVYGVEAKIKWPNDIYVEDKKICGILVENIVTGNKVTRSIAGMGININQGEFRSDAPNPVSLSQLTGKEYDLDELMDTLAFQLGWNLQFLDRGEGLHEDFLRNLWRNDGKAYKFLDKKTGEEIEARIADVAPSGLLTLELSGGGRRTYAFKEVEFMINE